MDKPPREYFSVESLPALGNVVHGAQMDPANSSFRGGKFDDLEAFICGSPIGVAGNDLQALFNGLVLRDRRCQNPTLIADDLGNSVKGGAHDIGDLRLVCYDRAAGCETDGGQGFLDNLDLGHVILFLDEVEPPLHVKETASSDLMFLLHLCAADPQQSCDAISLDALVKNRRNVIETETKLAQGNDSMQTLKLRRIIGSVAAVLVHVSWHEQTCGIPMPKHAVGHLPDLRESSDG